MPQAGKLYHGFFPGSEEEDLFTPKDVEDYENTVGKHGAWVYFAHNWYRGRQFPLQMATWIRAGGSVPFIRLMLRSSDQQNVAEPVYKLQAIIDGKFDADLKAWGAAAKAFATPLLVEWGTEVNGEWFSWNGTWNGGETSTGFGDPSVPDGPERFVAAFRHIVDVIRGQGAKNVSFVFHANCDDVPGDGWNAMENYFPGDSYVDLVGLSAYGPDESFRSMVDGCYPRLAKMSARPISVLEFGASGSQAATWAKNALTDLLSNRWPRIAAFSWWNEMWPGVNMRVQDNPALGQTFKDLLSQHASKLVTQPIVVSP